MDIKFIRDDAEEKAIKELNEILDTLSSKQRSSQAYAAKRFMLALFAASKKPPGAAPIAAEQPLVEMQMPYKKSALSIPVKIKPRPVAKPIIPIPEYAKKLEVPVPTPAPEAEVPEKNHEVDIPLPSDGDITEIGRLLLPYEHDYPLAILKDKNEVAVVRASLTRVGNEFVYILIEPVVDANALGIAKNLVSKSLRKHPKYFDDGKFMSKNLAKAMKKALIPYSDDYASKLKYFLKRDILGFGKVDALLRDPHVRSVVCDGLDKPVKIFFNNDLGFKTNVVFSNPNELNSFVKELAIKIGVKFSISGPTFEGSFDSWDVYATLGFGNVNSKFIVKKT